MFGRIIFSERIEEGRVPVSSGPTIDGLRGSVDYMFSPAAARERPVRSKKKLNVDSQEGLGFSPISVQLNIIDNIKSLNGIINTD